MAVSVIVPLYNDEGTIGACLRSLLHQTTPPLEIIVVDNGSTDRSVSTVEEIQAATPRPPIRIITETKRGPAAARNRGVHEARGEILAFTDSDCIPSPDWVERLTAAFTEGVHGVAGRILGVLPRNAIEKLDVLATTNPGEAALYRRYSPRSGGFGTANLSFLLRSFEKLGGFDEAFFYGEDLDFCARAYAQGFAIRFDPLVLVHHMNRSSIAAALHKSFVHGIVHARILRTHCPRYLLVELPGKTIEGEGWPVRITVNLSSLEKKVLALFLLSLLSPWLSLLVVGYTGYLFQDFLRRAKKTEMACSLPEVGAMILQLLGNSAAMTAGRIVGSVRYRVLCL